MTCCRTCLHVRPIETGDELILWCRRRRWKAEADECCDLYWRRMPGGEALVVVSTTPGREVETDPPTNHREIIDSSKRPKPGVVEKRSDWLAAILLVALFWSALAAVVVRWLL
jgi:hypothetical protein